MPQPREREVVPGRRAFTRTSASCVRTVRPSSGNGSSCGDAALCLSYGSRWRAANAQTRPMRLLVAPTTTPHAPLERGGRCTARAPEATVRRGSDQREAWSAAGAAATTVRAGGRSRVSSHPGTAPRRPTTNHGRASTAIAAFPRPSRVKQRRTSVLGARCSGCFLLCARASGGDAERPTWHSAQVGRDDRSRREG